MGAARWVGAGAALTVSGVMLASCGMVNALGDDDAGEQTATVGVLVPRDGWAEADGESMRAAVELAVEQTAGDIGGWVVDVVPVDEGENGTDALAELVDSDVIAVIGGLSTATVRAVQPVLDEAAVLFVSPANVEPMHTRGADPRAPLRPYPTYFRTAVGEESPAVALARYAVSSPDADAVAIVDGGDPGEARAFSAAVGDAGGEVVATARVDGDDVEDAIRAAEEKKAEAIFVAGSPSTAAAVAERVRGAGRRIELLGTSAFDGEFVAEAGGSAEAAVTAVPRQLEPTAGARSDDLSARLDAAGAPDPGTFGAAAYDAGTAVGTVLARCLPPASSAAAARKGCVGEMVQVDFAGVTGEVAFDRYGDRVGGVAELRVVRDGEWVQVGVNE